MPYYISHALQDTINYDHKRLNSAGCLLKIEELAGPSREEGQYANTF